MSRCESETRKRWDERMADRESLENWAAQRGVIIETTRIGHAAKVTAVDPVTLKEVSLTGPSNYDMRALGLMAARKLRYVLDKEGKR